MVGSSDQGADETRAFVAVRLAGNSWVVDLPRGESTLGSGSGTGVRLETEGIPPKVGVFQWDGDRLVLKPESSDPPLFLNGKKFDHAVELKAGDELSVGGAQLVVGTTMPVTAGGRRALTHHEFRERLYEEMARASRVGRPTSLVMVQARLGEGNRITQTALATFRAGDVMGTYAHDELEMLLPDTAGDVAEQVIDRLLKSSGTVGAVAGLAVAPEHGDNPERLIRSSRRALERARESSAGIETPPPRTPSSARPEVHDPSSQELMTELEKLAATDGPVMIVGELSSGKALFARVLHAGGPRSDAPFVVVPCASLTDDELDSLFNGSGSPAARAKGGTLLLDEVGDLSEDAQKALADMLERDGEDVQVVATTHRTLAGLVERGAFDQKLYDKLAGEVVEVPPLRNRPEDIIPLAERFAEEAGAESPVKMSPGALARLRSYPWPGNVLELRNAIERAVHLAGSGEILAEHLPSDVLPIGSGEGRLREHVDSVERDAIVKALADSNHNQTHAAKRLGISRRALIYKMEKYGLKPPPGTARKG